MTTANMARRQTITLGSNIDHILCAPTSSRQLGIVRRVSLYKLAFIQMAVDGRRMRTVGYCYDHDRFNCVEQRHVVHVVLDNISQMQPVWWYVRQVL